MKDIVSGWESRELKVGKRRGGGGSRSTGDFPGSKPNEEKPPDDQLATMHA
jgi:hypothetical protein